MKIIICGLGSMGKRRIRILQKIMPESMLIGVDIQEDRRKQTKETYGIVCCADLEEAILEYQPDIAFICSSPLSHVVLSKYCLQKGIHVFSELNLVSDGYGELRALSHKNNVHYFLSSTMQYRTEIQYICQKMNLQQGLTYLYHVGQYLADWHPWESYQSFFIGDDRTNGCREIMAIELPWLVRAFGQIKDVWVDRRKTSSLQIHYPDTYLINLIHERGNRGIFCVDVVSRKSVRRLEIFSEKQHLFWNGDANSLSEFDIEQQELISIQHYDEVQQDKQYASNIIENAYIDEVKTFFQVIANKMDNPYLLEQDEYILKWIDRIEGKQS